MNRIDAKFSELREAGRTAFMPYVCAGDPDLATTEAVLLSLEDAGADIVELGVPFSDPVGDGVVIQEASQRALAGGVSLRAIIEMVRRVREHSQLPIALMSYFNPIHKYGIEQVISDAADAGVDGFIIPDLSPDEADEFCAVARTRDVKTIFFIAPTSTEHRVEIVNRMTTGFIYCTSVTGVTGARDALPHELSQSLQNLRTVTDTPLVVGFGVSTPEQVKWLTEVADGVIVGSAVCRLIAEASPEGTDAVVRRLTELIRALSAPCRG